jgi:hypothetical protein
VAIASIALTFAGAGWAAGPSPGLQPNQPGEPSAWIYLPFAYGNGDLCFSDWSTRRVQFAIGDGQPQMPYMIADPDGSECHAVLGWTRNWDLVTFEMCESFRLRIDIEAVDLQPNAGWACGKPGWDVNVLLYSDTFQLMEACTNLRQSTNVTEMFQSPVWTTWQFATEPPGTYQLVMENLCDHARTAVATGIVTATLHFERP